MCGGGQTLKATWRGAHTRIKEGWDQSELGIESDRDAGTLKWIETYMKTRCTGCERQGAAATQGGGQRHNGGQRRNRCESRCLCQMCYDNK